MRGVMDLFLIVSNRPMKYSTSGLVQNRVTPVLNQAVSLARDPTGHVLLEVLTDSFADHDAVGCRAVAEFLAGRPDDEIQADVVGAALRILRPLHLS